MLTDNERYTLHHGDCLEVMKTFPSESVDCVITDPPYGINYSSFRTKSTPIANDDNLNWVNDFFSVLGVKVKPESHLYCFVDLEYSAEFLFAIRNNGWKVRNLLSIPRKIKGNGGGRIFQQQFEYCVFATKGTKEQGRKFNPTQILQPTDGYKKDKRFSAKEWLYRLPDFWHWTTASAFNHNRHHPNEKNVECLVDMIRLSTNQDEIVLDPFCGSGSTGVACMLENRKFIGIEKEFNYFEIAKSRIETATDQVSLFAEV